MSKAVAEPTNSLSSKLSCHTAIAIREQTRFYSLGVVIPEDDISIEFFHAMLAKFKISSSVDEDGELQIPEAFGPMIYLSLQQKRHWVVLHTGFDTPTLSADDRVEFAGSLNSDLAMAQFVATENGIGLGYYMYYRGGLSLDQFMAMAQRLGSLAFTAMKRYATFGMVSDQTLESEKRAATLN